jgi:uncharacterized protein YycO
MTSLKNFIKVLFAFFSFQVNAQTLAIKGLQEGDLLFQDLNCGELCDAIEAVTEGANGQDFSHCAMVIRDADSLVVVEAIGNKVQLNSIQKFFARSGDTLAVKNIVVGRVKQPYKELIPVAAANAKALVGQPYDDAFLPDNNKWYCSEVLYEAFRKASNSDFFELAPMTFKDPRTQAYFPAWINYYRELNVEIPEAIPGLNPGSISRSSKIEIVKIQLGN